MFQTVRRPIQRMTAMQGILTLDWAGLASGNCIRRWERNETGRREVEASDFPKSVKRYNPWTGSDLHYLQRTGSATLACSSSDSELEGSTIKPLRGWSRRISSGLLQRGTTGCAAAPPSSCAVPAPPGREWRATPSMYLRQRRPYRLPRTGSCRYIPDATFHTSHGNPAPPPPASSSLNSSRKFAFRLTRPVGSAPRVTSSLPLCPLSSVAVPLGWVVSMIRVLLLRPREQASHAGVRCSQSHFYRCMT